MYHDVQSVDHISTTNSYRRWFCSSSSTLDWLHTILRPVHMLCTLDGSIHLLPFPVTHFVPVFCGGDCCVVFPENQVKDWVILYFCPLLHSLPKFTNLRRQLHTLCNINTPTCIDNSTDHETLTDLPQITRPSPEPPPVPTIHI